MKEQIAIVM